MRIRKRVDGNIQGTHRDENIHAYKDRFCWIERKLADERWEGQEDKLAH